MVTAQQVTDLTKTFVESRCEALTPEDKQLVSTLLTNEPYMRFSAQVVARLITNTLTGNMSSVMGAVSALVTFGYQLGVAATMEELTKAWANWRIQHVKQHSTNTR